MHEGFDACDCRTRRRPRPRMMANQKLSIKEGQGLMAVGDGPAISQLIPCLILARCEDARVGRQIRLARNDDGNGEVPARPEETTPDHIGVAQSRFWQPVLCNPS